MNLPFINITCSEFLNTMFRLYKEDGSNMFY